MSGGNMSRFIMSIFLLMTIGFGGCGTPISKTVEEDGRVKRFVSGENAPKTIASEEIISFNCEFSLVTAVLEEESGLDGRLYKLSAVLENETVNCKVKCYDRFGDGENKDFTAEASFMTKLRDIVAKYNFAQHNGYSHEISGLPDMYGSKINIKYESGESIYAYDNQDCFIQFEAMKELVELFNTTK